jgi:hypothetical protein
LIWFFFVHFVKKEILFCFSTPPRRRILKKLESTHSVGVVKPVQPTRHAGRKKKLV